MFKIVKRYNFLLVISIYLMVSCQGNTGSKSTSAVESGEPDISEFRKVDINVDSIARQKFVVAKKDAKTPSPAEAKEAEVPHTKKTTKPKAPKKYPVIVFDSLTYRLPDMVEGDKVDLKFEFTNEGDAPLSIKEVNVECGCTTPSVPFLDIEPGKRASIGIQYNSVGKSGLQTPEITVTSNGRPKKTSLQVIVNVIDKEKKTAVDSLH